MATRRITTARCGAKIKGVRDPYTRLVGNRIYYNPFYLECRLPIGHEGPHETEFNGKPYLFPK